MPKPAPLTDDDLIAISGICFDILERQTDAGVDYPPGTPPVAAEAADGPELVGLPVDLADRILHEIQRLRSLAERAEICWRCEEKIRARSACSDGCVGREERRNRVVMDKLVDKLIP